MEEFVIDKNTAWRRFGRVVILCSLAVLIATAGYFISQRLDGWGHETDQGEPNPNEEKVLEDPQDFDLLNNAWWEANTGCKITAFSEENTYASGITIDTDDFVLEGITLVNSSGSDEFIIVNSVDAAVRDSVLEGAVRVYSDREKGSVMIENVTFVTERVRRYAIGGMGITARFNLISSLNDGINPTGGLSSNNLIEYNWFKGPGYRVDDNHMDGIQFWREGNAVIRRNRFSGFDNAHILIKSDEAPRFGAEPIRDILITENYFEDKGPRYYYLFVCEASTNPDQYYLTRPQYITITNNCFESTKLHPIYTGLESTESAMFVRTEEERDEGVWRQAAYPEVLDQREEAGWARSAVDARTWIVWNGNYYKSNGLEVPPHDGKANKGWYDLSAERERFPIEERRPEGGEVPSVSDGMITIRLMQSSINTDHLLWRVINHTKEPLFREMIFPDRDSLDRIFEPGENLVSAKRMPGENDIVLRSVGGDEMEQLLSAKGLSYIVKDVSSLYKGVSNENELIWNVYNPNPFILKAEWSFSESGESGMIWLPGESLYEFRTPADTGTLIISWDDEYGGRKTLAVPQD